MGAINAKGTINANKSGMVRMSVKGVNTANKTTITTAKMNKKLQAFAKTFRLGFATWGGVFLVLMVMGLIASVLQGIVSIPWYVIYIVKMVFTMSDGGATSSSVGLNFAQYLFSILMLYGSYLSAIFSIVGLVYQYGHASEVVDSITVESDIDNFDKL